MNSPSEDPREDAFDHWLKQDTPVSKDFTERTLAAISEDAQREGTPTTGTLSVFPTFVSILAAAAALTVALILFEPDETSPAPSLQSADTLIIEDDTPLTYNDLNYLVIEDILEMQEELEIYAALD